MSEIVMNVDIRQDEYTKYVNDTFDLKISDANNVHIPFNFKLENLHDWNIGIVCGASGTGKSADQKYTYQCLGQNQQLGKSSRDIII